MYLTLEYPGPIWNPGAGFGTPRARRGSSEAQVTVRRAGKTAGRKRTGRPHYVPLGKPWRTDSRSPKSTQLSEDTVDEINFPNLQSYR